jgi:hypothetical protein
MAEHEDIDFEGELKKALDREPFNPVTIVLTSGGRYEISDPWQVAIGASTVIVLPPRSPHVIFRKNQIVAVEIHEPAA